jgi:homoserine dehydrogenase
LNDRKIDSIYDFVDKNCRLGRFDVIDSTLTKLKVDRMDIDGIISWMTTTNWCGSKLKNRKQFYNKVLSQQERLGFTENDLRGLECS